MTELDHYTPPTRGYVGTAPAREHTGGAYGLRQVHISDGWVVEPSRRQMWIVISLCTVGVAAILAALAFPDPIREVFHVFAR